MDTPIQPTPINTLPVVSTPQSILDQPCFPPPAHAGRPWAITPQQWLAAITMWETDPSVSIMKACKDQGFTHPVLYDVRDRYCELATRYDQARHNRARLLAEQTIAIADDAANDLLVTDRGVQANNANVRRAECRIGARQWLAERMNSAEYAPKSKLDITQTTKAINLNVTPQDLQGADGSSLLSTLESLQ